MKAKMGNNAVPCWKPLRSKIFPFDSEEFGIHRRRCHQIALMQPRWGTNFIQAPSRASQRPSCICLCFCLGGYLNSNRFSKCSNNLNPFWVVVIVVLSFSAVAVTVTVYWVYLERLSLFAQDGRGSPSRGTGTKGSI